MSNSITRQVVIIPTYNEKENIRRILEAVLGLEVIFDILVIDDNSPDGTANIVRELMKEYPERVYLQERPGKLGLGTAYLSGFKWALDQGYHYIMEMDADFSHNPNDLHKLLETCRKGEADVAIGSRYINGVNVVNWPLGRVLMSYFASVYVRCITGMNIMDTTAGFICYSAEVLRTVELDKIHFKGYAFQIEMKYMAKLSGFLLKEVPIVFVNRQEGVSKMNSSIFGEAFLGVIQLRWRAMTRKYPQKCSRRLESKEKSV